MDFVSIDLAGKTYRLRLVPDDLQEICRRLTALQPPRADKVTPPVLGQLLVNLDPDAIQFCLLYGLRHTPEYRRIDVPDVQKLVGEAIRDGAQYTDFRRPIFKTLIACGLADFAPVVKLLDQAQAQGDGEAEEETDPGNASTPSSPSPIRSSTPSSWPAESGTST